MLHAPARLSFVFALLIGVLTLFTTAQAQTSSNDLEPKVTGIPASAFHTNSGVGIAATGTQTLQTGVITAPTLFTDMLFRWKAPESNTAPLQLEVRVSSDGSDWTKWGAIQPSDDPADPDEDPDIVWSDPIYAGESRFYQLRVTLAPGADLSHYSFDNIQVHTVDTRPANVTVQQSSSSGQVSASSTSPPPYISRTGWGNPDGELAPNAPPRYSTATHLVVHHTADPNTLRSWEPDWAARVRAIWSFHTHSRGWGDIGYNWLIDPNGVIYAGRAGSTDPNRDAVGFHDAANWGSMGVSVMGTYDTVAPSTAAQNSLVNLLVWKASQRSIDPQGSSVYVGCSYASACINQNAGGVVPNIAGHRQVLPGQTACPGDKFMEILPTIRQRVAQYIQANSQARLISAALKTPSVAVGETAQVDLTVKNTGSLPIGTQTPHGGASTNLTSGWVYDEAECYAGNASSPAYREQKYRLRATLGYSLDSARVPIDCSAGPSNLPWRWGLTSPLQPGETRTIRGYVRFRTPGTYKLRANLVNELIGLYGTDGKGAYFELGTLTVVPERNLPSTLRLDNAMGLQAEVYHLAPLPNSLLARTDMPISVKEGAFVGTFPWDGSNQNWGVSGPLGLTDRFIVRQVRPFHAPVSGTYRFRLTSDDGGWLWVNGQLVINNGGLHSTRSVEGEVYLQAGLHTLAVKMFDLAENAFAGYAWRPPGASTFSIIPPLDGTASSATRSTAEQQLVLAADDFGGSGIKTLRYQINNGAEQQSNSRLVPLSFSHGIHTIKYQAEDNNGNRSTWQTITFTVNTTPPSSTLTGTVRSNGIIELFASSEDPNVAEFEIQARNTMDGSLQLWRTSQGQSVFFGTPGQTYEFRVRASNGITWATFPSSPQVTLRVPENASFARVFVPGVMH